MRRELALFSHWIAAKKGKNTKAQSFSDRWRDESFGPWRFTGRGFGIQTWALHPVVRGSNPRRSISFYIRPWRDCQ